MVALPQRQIIEAHFKEKKGTLDIPSIARKCLLPEEEVEIWVQHVKKKESTREAGLKKAKETR